MNQTGMVRQSLCAGMVFAGLLLIAAAPSQAGFKTTVGGISVSYSGTGANAYYDPSDGTLTVEVWEDGGSLKITAGKDAHSYWGDYCDIYILAAPAVLKSIAIKGLPDCFLFLAGQVYHVEKFSLTGGCVGSTDYYPDMGIGMASMNLPSSISIKHGWTTAPLLGVSYDAGATASAARAGAGKNSAGSAVVKEKQSPVKE